MAPTFMESLAANPSGSSVYGQPGQSNYGPRDVINFVRQLKQADLEDFQKRSSFMSDLDFRQAQRMKNIYPPESLSGNQQGQPNVVMQDNSPSPFQREELGIRQSQLGLEKERLGQQGKLGQEAIDVRSAQEKLNQQKSDQINENKRADLERKTQEANDKLELARRALDDKTKSAADQLQAHKNYQDLVEQRHKLEMERKQHEFDVTSDQHDRQIKAMETRLKQAGLSTTTTEIDPTGTKKTVTTRKGSEEDENDPLGIRSGGDEQ